MDNLLTVKKYDLFSKYERNGYVKLDKLFKDSFIKKLNKRTLDLMLGKKIYKGMFFQLDSKDGKYKNIDTKKETFQVSSLNYRKIKDLEFDDFGLENYNHHPAIKFEVAV